MSTLHVLSASADIQALVTSEIRAWMGRRGITQAQIADALGLTQSQFSKRMRGKIPINIAELGKIAARLGVTPIDLLGGPSGYPPDGAGTPGSRSSLPEVRLLELVA